MVKFVLVDSTSEFAYSSAKICFICTASYTIVPNLGAWKGSTGMFKTTQVYVVKQILG